MSVDTETVRRVAHLARIAVVEDEVAIVSLLRYNLEREGFRVYSTGDGEEAALSEGPRWLRLDFSRDDLRNSCAAVRLCGYHPGGDIG